MIYFLSKIFTYLFLPPGIFIAAIFAASALCKKFRKIFFSLALIFLFLSTEYGSNILIKPLENRDFNIDRITPDYVVVLGGGMDRGDIATQSGATERILKGMAIAKNKKIPLVFTGYEADFAKKSIEYIKKSFEINIKTIYESRSFNTYQNAKNCSRLLTDKNIILVTSAYHMPRAYKIFKHFGFKIFPIKTDFKTKDTLDIWSFFPKMGNLKTSYLALHEYLGILSLYLRGIF